ncbi:thioredoxin family protein, partial [Bacillus cereus]|uniref:thioredoxin family protein n=2 Tax=Bacillus TaxID=1386 RepID=UPI00320962E1
ITKGNINEHIKLGVTLVDFYAPWCGPCKIQLPIVEELVKDIGNQANIAKVNIEEELDLATEYNVQSVPTLLLLTVMLWKEWFGFKARITWNGSYSIAYMHKKSTN